MGIEDPRAAARREQYGIEDESGASRDDITEALEEVAAGRVPRDIVAFRQLVAELQAWPYLEQEDAIRSDGPSPYAEITETGLSRSERKAQAMVRRDPWTRLLCPGGSGGCCRQAAQLPLACWLYGTSAHLYRGSWPAAVSRANIVACNVLCSRRSDGTLENWPDSLPFLSRAQARAKVNEEEELIPEKDLSDFLPKWCEPPPVFLLRLRRRPEP